MNYVVAVVCDICHNELRTVKIASDMDELTIRVSNVCPCTKDLYKMKEIVKHLSKEMA